MMPGRLRRRRDRHPSAGSRARTASSFHRAKATTITMRATTVATNACRGRGGAAHVSSSICTAIQTTSTFCSPTPRAIASARRRLAEVVPCSSSTDRARVSFLASPYSCSLRPLSRFVPSRAPPRRPDEMSLCRGRRARTRFARPGAFLVLRAAISSARSSDSPLGRSLCSCVVLASPLAAFLAHLSGAFRSLLGLWLDIVVSALCRQQNVQRSPASSSPPSSPPPG